MREPLSVEDVLASRMVSDPLTVRDCCLVTDGGGAYVLVSADRAQGPAEEAGLRAGQCHRGVEPPDLLDAGPHRHGGQRSRAASLRDGRACRRKDIDVVQLYDAFTINTLLFLEDLGFCAKGEGGALRRRTAPSRPAASWRSTPTAAACPACIPACTASSR